MKLLLITALTLLFMGSCDQAPGKTKTESPAGQIEDTPKQITPGTYLCWQNDQTSFGDRKLLGELTVTGNTYQGDFSGTGKYSFDPLTKILKFDGGGFDQRKNGKEWIGIFYKKGEKFIDGSGGTAANTMFIITSLADWNNGLKKAWIQQCDLK